MPVHTYLSRVVEIEAIEILLDNVDELKAFCPMLRVQVIPVSRVVEGKIVWEDRIHTAFIPTAEGEMRAHIGDFLIKGLRGEFYPCHPDVFRAKYDRKA